MTSFINISGTDYNLGRRSYNDFFQFFNSGEKDDYGIHKILSNIFPISDKTKSIKISYKGYSIDLSTYDEEVYMSRYLSYTAKIKIHLEIDSKAKIINHVFTINHVPIMVNDMYFMINGTKKIMIYQLLKTGGVYYEVDSNSRVNNTKLISTSGSRIELKLNQREIINIYVNTSKKIHLSEFFSLLDEEKLFRFVKAYKSQQSQSIFLSAQTSFVKYLLLFGTVFNCRIKNGLVYVGCTREDIQNHLFTRWNKYRYENGEIIIEIDDFHNCFFVTNTYLNVEKDEKIDSKQAKNLFAKEGSIVDESLRKKIALLEAEDFIFANVLFFMKDQDVICRSFCMNIDKSLETSDEGEELQGEEEAEDTESEADYEEEEAVVKPSDEFDEDIEEENSPLSIEYPIDNVIRSRLNEILNIKYSNNSERLTEEDIILFFYYFGKQINKPSVEKQNYDFLFYKKVKKPEDFISNIIMKKINKLKNSIKYVVTDKDNKSNIDDFLNSYNASNEVKKLFSSHPLVQFLDQTNHLSELSHRRRISVFNLINIEKYQVSFEGRDINSSYYGRICPIETPEGSNIGLINSVAINAQIDSYGFLITPYYKIIDGSITSEIVYLNAYQESNLKIAYWRSDFNGSNTVLCRFKDNIISCKLEECNYMDINSVTILSMASSLIPFIQHNDARRSLMGANMQRQAVPLVKPNAPVVGTGTEFLVVDVNKNSVKVKNDTDIVYSCAEFIIYTDFNLINDDIHCDFVNKYSKTNMRTCGNATIKVKNNDRVKGNTTIVDGCSVDEGELAIGQNILVGFLSWNGYSFEDSIVISERILRDSLFESIHISEVDIKAKEIDVDIVEKITLDNPNDEIRKMLHLDSRGIVKVGSKIKPCQVLVSRVVPIEGDLSVEDSVLSIIFGKDISEFKDVSYKATYDIHGTVMDVKYFNRSLENSDKEFSRKLLEKSLQIQRIMADAIINKVSKAININAKDLSNLRLQCESASETQIEEILSSFIETYVTEEDVEIYNFISRNSQKIKNIKDHHNNILSSNRSLNIENNVIEYVRLLIANRRQLNIGDKLSGRHGNKGVISCICPIEDMPYMEDGTPLDMLLNPVGIPNRLNIGQIMESYLGLTSYEVSRKVKLLIRTSNPEKAKSLLACYLSKKCNRNKDLSVDDAIARIMNDQYIVLEAPVFNSVCCDEIKAILKEVEASEDGLYRLRCGITGDYFNRKVNIGLKYIMKLNHMAIDKISARETGGYSTILQQPLPRKANYGGQRFGEMEAWAVEAYGAMNVIRETLTVRSDDIVGRNKLYESILNTEYVYKVNLPEIVNVVSRYLNGACIKLDFIKKK